MCSKWSLAYPTDFGCGPSSAKTSWGAEHSRKTWATICLYSTWLSQRLYMTVENAPGLSIRHPNTVIMHHPFKCMSASFCHHSLMKVAARWKNNCQFLASANESLVMSVPSHSWSGQAFSRYNSLYNNCALMCIMCALAWQQTRQTYLDTNSACVHT